MILRRSVNFSLACHRVRRDLSLPTAVALADPCDTEGMNDPRHVQPDNVMPTHATRQELNPLTPLAVVLVVVACAALLAAYLRRPKPPQCLIELDTPHGVFTSSPVNAPIHEPRTGGTLSVIVDSDAPTEVDITLTGHRAADTELVVLARASTHALAPLGDESAVRAALSAPWPADQPFPR